jgi:hypothetical protein
LTFNCPKTNRNPRTGTLDNQILARQLARPSVSHSGHLL